jgi:hypothetical protein
MREWAGAMRDQLFLLTITIKVTTMLITTEKPMMPAA